MHHGLSSARMENTRKRLRRKTPESPFNYAKVLVLNMMSWMPYLCLQENSFFTRRSPSEFTWYSVKCLRLLCKSMNDAWDLYFYVKLHINVPWIRRLRRVVSAESLTFLRSDDACHRILTYKYFQNSVRYSAAATLPWKSLLILQRSKDFEVCSRHEDYDVRDFMWYDWRDYNWYALGSDSIRMLDFR